MGGPQASGQFSHSRCLHLVIHMWNQEITSEEWPVPSPTCTGVGTCVSRKALLHSPSSFPSGLMTLASDPSSVGRRGRRRDQEQARSRLVALE